MIKLKIKKGSQVQVIAGAEKGKKGTVIEVDPTHLKIKVQGVKIQTHFDKKEGILTKEGFIDYSNVKMIGAAPAAKKESKSKAKAKSK